jgi:hypothetical protein
MSMILSIQAFTYGWLMGCAATAAGSVTVFGLAYYFVPYFKKVRRAKRINILKSKRKGFKKKKSKKNNTLSLDLLIPLITLFVISIGIVWIIHTHVIGHIPSVVWWILIIIALIIILAVIYNNFKDKVTVGSIENKTSTSTTQNSTFSFPFKKMMTGAVIIVAIILVWIYFPAINNWCSDRSSNQTSQASVTTDTHDNDQFSPVIITYGQVYIFQEGVWYKCPIGEQYYEAYASPGDNIEKYTSTTGVHWVRVQNQTDKVFFSQTPISSFPYN